MYLTVLPVLFSLFLSLWVTQAQAELSVASYCELAIKKLEQQAKQFRDLIDLCVQYKNERNKLIQEESILKGRYDLARALLFSSYGTTADEYVSYRGKHSLEVERYLKTQTFVQHRIESLSNEVRSLFDKYESLKGKE